MQDWMGACKDTCDCPRYPIQPAYVCKRALFSPSMGSQLSLPGASCRGEPWPHCSYCAGQPAGYNRQNASLPHSACFLSMQTSHFGTIIIKGVKGTSSRVERPDRSLQQGKPGPVAFLDSSRNARLSSKANTFSKAVPAVPALRPAGRKCMTSVRSRRALKMAALKRETLIGQVRQRFRNPCKPHAGRPATSTPQTFQPVGGNTQ